MPDQKRTISIFIETGAAEKAYDRLFQKEKQLKEELAKATDPKQVARINSELAKLAEPLDRAAKKAKGELSPAFTDVKRTVDELGKRLRKMSTEDADYSKVLAQYKQANIELEKQKEKLDTIEKEKGGNKGFLNSFFGNLAATAVAKATSLVSDFFSTAFEEAEQAEESTARFKATLDNLGKTDVFDRLTKKATDVAKQFTYLDNDDVVGVFNKLIDYGKLTEKQMNDLLPVIINFAARQRISLAESTDVITKSLEGNAKGLKTYGISLSEASTPAERLKIIMSELKDKVDGSAEAFQNTSAGGIATAKQQYRDLAEELGNQLLPALNNLISFVTKSIKGLGYLANNVKDLFNFQAPGTTNSENAVAAEKLRNDQLLSNYYYDKRLKIADELIAKEKTLADKNKKRQEIIDNQKAFLAKGTGTKAERLGIERLIGDLSTETIGKGDPNFDPAAQKKAEEQRKKVLEDQKRFLEELRKLNLEYGLINQSDFDREIEQTIEKYHSLRELAHGNATELKKLEEDLGKALFQIQVKYSQKALEAFDKADAEKQKKFESFVQTIVKQGDRHLQFFETTANEGASKASALRKAQLEYDVAVSFGKKKFDAQKKLLDEEEAQAVQAAIKKGENTEIINKEFDLKRAELEKQNLVDRFNQYIGFAQQIVGILSIIDDAKTQKENAELARDQKANDKKKANLERRLKQGVITQLEYDRQAGEIDKKQEQRQHQIMLKQFKRNQRMQEIQAAMSGAQAVVSTIAALPGPLDIASLGLARALQIGLMIATTAAQIGFIASQKPPELEFGGMLRGPSHRQGGIPIVAEGDEAVVNKRTMADKQTYQLTGTPSSIISWLNGLHGVQWESGATGGPVWSTTRPAGMNFSHINQSIDRVRMFANGGVVTQSGAPGSGGVSLTLPPEFLMVMVNLQATVSDMQGTLDNIQKRGILAHVPITHLKEQEQRLADIQGDATMKP